MHITSTLDLRHPRSHRRGRAAAIGAAGGSGGHSMLVGGSLPTPANRAATTAAAVDAASAAAEVSSEPVAILVWLRTLGWVGGGLESWRSPTADADCRVVPLRGADTLAGCVRK